ncbi:MAG: hypothetical protein JKY17_03730 [Magnetovibrio sp.]|nr:hypothetical protein [Magnetovibrio sp.]
MGTKEQILKSQKELKSALSKIGFSQRKFATEFFNNDSEHYDEELRKTFIDTFNRQLDRPRKSKKTLNQLTKYLDFIYGMEGYTKAGMIPPRNIIYSELNIDRQDSLARISRSIDRKILKKSDQYPD